MISLAFGLGLYFACRFGWLGARLESFALYYLVIMLLILGGRALLTELGVRRKRVGFERRFEK